MSRYDWDPDKAQANLRKHGVSFEEAGTVDEIRCIGLGRTGAMRPTTLISSWSEDRRRGSCSL